MSYKRRKLYSDEDILKVFLFSFEEYLRFATCFKRISNQSDESDDMYVFLQTKLLLVRKYEDIGDPIYIRNILDAIDKEYPEQSGNTRKLTTKIDNIENSKIEILLSDGNQRSLHKAIEDIIYGLYLHADKEKIEALIKTNMSTYMFVANKYLSSWESILNEAYVLINSVVTDKYSREEFKKASIIFEGKDNTQGRNIKSAPYWSNLRGEDAEPDELAVILAQQSSEEIEILALVGSFIKELKKTDYSIHKLRRMIYPVVKPYWGDFETAHNEIADLEIGFSSKVRFNETHNIAHVLLFKNFSPSGLIVINQEQYSEDIVAVYLKKANNRAGWKIVSINIEPEKLIKTITINPNDFIKKILKQKP